MRDILFSFAVTGTYLLSIITFDVYYTLVKCTLNKRCSLAHLVSCDVCNIEILVNPLFLSLRQKKEEEKQDDAFDGHR